MNGKFLRLLLVAVMALCMGTVVAACGDDEEPSGSGGAAATAEPEKKIKIGLVTDIGGLNDRGFNALAYKALKQAESELGAEIRAISSSQELRLRAEPLVARAPEVRPDRRQRLPDGRGDREGRERVPGRRSSRSSTSRRRR